MAIQDGIFKFYIKNYLNGSSYVTSETMILEIPSASASDSFFIDPKISMEMGKAGSLEFKMEMGHPYYGAILQMKTIIRVEYFGRTLFRGRVLTIDNTMYGTRTIHCEGDLAFLLDTMMEAVRDELKTKKTLVAWIQEVITHHNEWAESDKQFSLGQVPGNYQEPITSDQVIEDDTRKYDQDSWASTLSILEGLTSQYGGYWRTRYEGGRCYLDWMRNYFDRQIGQTIEIGKNLIDISNSLEVNNLFTVVIPIGSRKGKSLYLDPKYVEVPEVVDYFGRSAEVLHRIYHSPEEYENAISNYGYIYKTVKFENAETTGVLKSYCMDWIANNYHGGLSSFDVSAFDLKVIGESDSPLWVGDLVTVTFPRTDGSNQYESETYTIIKIEYDLYNPEGNKYTIGIPDSSLNKTYGEAKKTTSSKGSVKSPSTKQGGDLLSELLGLENETDEEKNTMRRNMTALLKTVLYGGSTSDGTSEGEVQHSETTREFDNDDDNILKYILGPDGLKTTLFDGLKGNITDLFTVGGDNTIGPTTKRGAKAESGGTWGDTSPIILDGKTGDITSKKGTVSIQDLQVGYDWETGAPYPAWINSLGAIGGTNLHIKASTDESTDGRIVIENNLGSSQSEHSIYIKSGDGNISHAGNGSVLLQGGGFHTLFGDIDTFSGNIETVQGAIKGPTIGGNVINTLYDATDGLSGDDLAIKAFVECEASELDGVITFKFWGPNKVPGTDEPIKTVNFNMADTQFFKDAVAAAEEQGKQEGTGTIDINTGNAAWHSSNSLADLANMVGTTEGNMHYLFNGTALNPGEWYGFKVTCGEATPRYYYVKT